MFTIVAIKVLTGAKSVSLQQPSHHLYTLELCHEDKVINNHHRAVIPKLTTGRLMHTFLLALRNCTTFADSNSFLTTWPVSVILVNMLCGTRPSEIAHSH